MLTKHRSDSNDKRLQTRFGCVHLYINDCSFQDNTLQIIDVWVRASKAFVLVCSLTDRKTLPPVEEIVNRIELVKDVDKGGANIILAANQCDDEEHREIAEQELKEFCIKNGIRYWFEVSAKTDENVTELFTCAAELGTDILEKQHELVKKLENGIPIVSSKKKCTIL
jgi:GTPase SAR1 family protein